MTADSARLVALLKEKKPLAAMLAPSFPIVYDYPEIVARLRKLGFAYVVEVTAGAKKTNEEVLELLKKNPTARFITSPCPGFVRMVRSKYPQLLPYLAFKADSPMVATARIVREKYPGAVPVFIGPCVAKKLESSEDYPDLNILVLTYRELDTVFQELGIGEVNDEGASFDISEETTRIYPMDGGLTLTSGAKSILKEEELRIVSGWKDIPKVLAEFDANPSVRFVDILFCEQGCINGPGIGSTLTLDQRKEKVLAFSKNQYHSHFNCLESL
ncbi:MAG: [Fe-Fe] hydrogenase large subunit C-terminal domain-containing protein [Candidatus Peribacteraceae bacterium]|jgi:iron only hydrogenase large subunit-like protein